MKKRLLCLSLSALSFLSVPKAVAGGGDDGWWVWQNLYDCPQPILKKYDEVSCLSDGVAWVKKGTQFGIVNAQGKVLVAPNAKTTYDDVRLFVHGLAPVAKDGMWGFINKQGKVIVPIKYDYVEEFNQDTGLATVWKDDKSGLIDAAGKTILPIKYDKITRIKAGGWLVETDGKKIILDNKLQSVANLEYESVWDFSDNDTTTQVIKTKGGKRGLIDIKGNLLVPFEYDVIYSFKDGLASFQQNNKYGFLNEQGKVVVPAKYDHAFGFENGLAVVKLNEKKGLIDKTGKEILPTNYVEIYGLSNEWILVRNNDYNWEFFDRTGKIAIPTEYDVANSFSEGLAFVKTEDKSGFINKDGNFVINLPKDYSASSGFKNGLAVISNAKYKKGVIDQSGNTIIPFDYDDISTFEDGIAKVKKNGKYGYINKSNQIIIPIVYDSIHHFKEHGITQAEQHIDGKTKILFINKANQILDSFEW